MKSKFSTLILLCTFCVWSATAQTQLWGTCASGGASGQGTIFSADANGNNFHTEYSLVNALGAMPNGSPVLANNGKLYGVTELGGYGDSCVVYSFEPSTGTFTDIHDLFQFTQLGWEAKSGLLKAEDGTLYGLCGAGGANGGGVIFKIDPTTDVYTDIFDFNPANGSNPYGSLIQLLDGKLYGMAQSGGANNAGVLFSFDPNASLYTKLYIFDNVSGGHPTFGKLMQASDSKIYGTTQQGGAIGNGVLFSFDLSSGVYTDLYDFDGTHGSTPNGSLIQATNGTIYGMTYSGGTNSEGVLFSFDIATSSYSDLFDFNGTNGSSPRRGVTQASNGKLYGTTSGGGTSSAGVAFSYDITNGTFTKLSDFSASTTGSSPDCEIIETPQLSPLGILALSGKKGVTIGPNPATNYLNITGTDKADVIQFTDVLGKELSTLTISSFSRNTLDISHYPAVFFAKGKNGDVKKIVKE